MRRIARVKKKNELAWKKKKLVPKSFLFCFSREAKRRKKKPFKKRRLSALLLLVSALFSCCDARPSPPQFDLVASVAEQQPLVRGRNKRESRLDSETNSKLRRLHLSSLLFFFFFLLTPVFPSLSPFPIIQMANDAKEERQRLIAAVVGPGGHVQTQLHRHRLSQRLSSTSTSTSSSSPTFVSSPAEFAPLVANAKPYARKHDAAVVILTMGSSEERCPFFRELDANFVKTNPADVFVFTVAGDDQSTSSLAECLATLPNFYVVDMIKHAAPLGWGTPDHLKDRRLWGGPWTEGYRQMGHWRLTKQFSLMKNLGYRYALQIDDDSLFPSPGVSENLFETMKREKLKIGGRASFPEGHNVALGLPELARYFIVSEKFEPSPLLYSHCKPPNMEGLFSDLTGKENAPGWDRWMFYGNFVIFDLEWIHEEMVQRFINLISQSGGHFRFRWNEQASLAMVWQMFVREGEYKVFKFPYVHGVVDSRLEDLQG